MFFRHSTYKRCEKNTQIQNNLYNFFVKSYVQWGIYFCIILFVGGDLFLNCLLPDKVGFVGYLRLCIL